MRTKTFAFRVRQDHLLSILTFVSSKLTVIRNICTHDDCRSPDSLLQLQLAQLRKRGDAERVFAQLPPFHVLQRQWPLVPAVTQTADAETDEPIVKQSKEAQQQKQ